MAQGDNFPLYRELAQLFTRGDIDEVKRFITPQIASRKNIHRGHCVATIFCSYAKDDLVLLSQLVSLGVSFMFQVSKNRWNAPIHFAAKNNKVKIVRALIDMDKVNVNMGNGGNYTPLRFALNNANVAKILLDAGAHYDKNAPQWVRDFMLRREKTRLVCIVVLGQLLCRGSIVLQSGNGRDVLRMVARCIWSTRGE